MTIISPGKMNMISHFEQPLPSLLTTAALLGCHFDFLTLDSAVNNLLPFFTDADNTIIHLHVF